MTEEQNRLVTLARITHNLKTLEQGLSRDIWPLSLTLNIKTETEDLKDEQYSG